MAVQWLIQTSTSDDPAYHLYSTDNSDFASGMYNVTFRPDSMVATLSIRAHADLIEEGPEVFQVLIQSTNVGNVHVGAANRANVTISDTTGRDDCTLHSAHLPCILYVHPYSTPPLPHTPPPLPSPQYCTM